MPAEMELSRKVSRSLKTLACFVCSKEAWCEKKSNETISTDSWWPIGTLEISVFKRGDGSIHRLFELDRGSGLLKVGDGAISSGLTCGWLRCTRYPLPWERTDHPAFRCCKLSGGIHAALLGEVLSNLSQRWIKNCSSWDMCAIIEWTKSRNWPNSSREGHRIFLGDPQDGLNRAGFLVQRNFAGSLGDFKSRGRTVALNFDWQGKSFAFGLPPSSLPRPGRV